jgi:hypothetical protein
MTVPGRLAARFTILCVLVFLSSRKSVAAPRVKDTLLARNNVGGP